MFTLTNETNVVNYVFLSLQLKSKFYENTTMGATLNGNAPDGKVQNGAPPDVTAHNGTNGAKANSNGTT